MWKNDLKQKRRTKKVLSLWRKPLSFDVYLKASGVSRNQFYIIVADIRKEIGTKPKHQPRYI